jgi:hypothetical protein
MLIFKGCYCAPNGFDYQLFHADGTPTTRDYHGRGVIVQRGEDSFVVLGNPVTDCHLPEYRIAAEPTQNSVDYVEGYRHALRQKRAKAGATWSERFMDGWRQGWQDRGNDTVRDELRGSIITLGLGVDFERRWAS